MKRIFAFFLAAAVMFIAMQLSAQTTRLVPTLTISSSDTLSATQTKNYDRSVTGNYNWSVSVAWDHISGRTDSCSCYLQESVDGTNYKTVAGATTAVFGSADGSYIWSGGTGNLPVVWAPNYLRVSCVHKNTGTGRPYVKLQLKNL